MGLVTFLMKWSSYAILFAFATVSLASGLYYLAELVEEYERLTRKIIKYAIWSVLAVHLLVWLLEGYPFIYICIGMLSHLVYYQLLRKFPQIELTSIIFIISCVMLFASHVVWFMHFTQVWYPFEEIFSFFLICVWLVPFAFFISLTSDEDTLPYGSTISSTGEPLTSEHRRPGRVNRLVSFFQHLKRKIEEKLPVAEFKSSHHTPYKTF
jgi:hypothetical protein